MSVARIGPYELLAELGYGGMGSVYLAERVGPGTFRKRVALKTIHPHLARQEAFETMFLDEARLAASMHHPNIAQVFDLGRADGELYMALEYMRGDSLAALRDELVARGKTLPMESIAWLVAEAAEGLHHAHEMRDEDGQPLRIVHRDVSPQNLFVTLDGHVKVMDFGVARAEGRLAKTTETGRLKGKCAYMAPEQVFGDGVDHRADVFALGIVAWELITGRRLFAAETDAETLMRISSHDVPAPSTVESSVPPALEAIVLRALSADPAERPATARDFAVELREIAGSSRAHDLAARMTELFGATVAEREKGKIGLGSRVNPDATTEAGGPPPEGEARGRDRRLGVGLLLLVVLGAAAGLGFWWTRDQGPREGPVEPAQVVEAPTPPSEAEPSEASEAEPSEPTVAEAEPAAAPDLGAPPPERSPRRRRAAQPPPTMEPASEPATAEPGTLDLVTLPWATVLIDGRSYGNTPLVGRSVPSGRLTLELRPQGVGTPTRRTITVPAGGHVRHRFDLTSGD
ncbi:MAG: serine/threonine protein kinase [Deltaproteobacteria bacterium]|nr:serine/threonine protein kinase [Deltaproteobacteria bacterium]